MELSATLGGDDSLRSIREIGYLIALAALWSYRRWHIRGYKNWPLVQARVEGHRIEERQVQGGKIVYHFVRYSYEFKNARYSGEFEALEPWDSHYTLETPVEVMHPVGQVFQVHVKPADPTNSVAVRPDPLGMPKAI
jgi:hypothetical protein